MEKWKIVQKVVGVAQVILGLLAIFITWVITSNGTEVIYGVIYKEINAVFYFIGIAIILQGLVNIFKKIT